MTMAIPELESGSETQRLQRGWSSIQERVFSIVGQDAVMFPIDNPAYGRYEDIEGGAATIVGITASSDGIIPVLTNTQTAAIPPKIGPLAIPELNVDGTLYTTPNNAYWTQNGGFSCIMWVHNNGSNTGTWMSKWDASGTNREWWWGMTSSAQPRVYIYDESNAAQIGQAYPGIDGASYRRYMMLSMTWDGGTSNGGCKTWKDGVLGTSPGAGGSGSGFSGMDNSATLVQIGSTQNGLANNNMNVMGGPLSPIFTPNVLTAAQMLNYYRLTAPALGVLA